MREVVETKPDSVQEKLNQGKLYKKNGDLDRAEECFREVIRKRPDSVAAYNNLGNVLQAKDRVDEAVACYEKVLELNPDTPQVHNNLANIYKIQKEYDKAVTGYKKAIELNPGFVTAYNNLGMLYAERNKDKLAIETYASALSCRENDPETNFLMGQVCQKTGDYETAVKFYRKTLKYKPQHKQALYNLGICLHIKGTPKMAAKCYRRLIQLEPDRADAHFSLGKAFQDTDKPDLAIRCYEEVLDQSPDYAPAHYELIRIRADLCDWKKREKDALLFDKLINEQLENSDAIKDPIPMLNLNYFDLPASVHLDAAKNKAANTIERILELKKRLNFRYKHNKNNKLRIGYISPDFRRHAVGELIYDIFRHHNREKFEICAYSMLPEIKGDFYQQRIMEGCDYFVDISHDSFEKAARKINNDRIDILIDLAGYTTYTHTEILALEPAPVQAHFLGYPDTMGADFIRYILADSWLIPDELEKEYTEKVIFLPHAFVSSPAAISKRQMTRHEFGLPENAFVFCCFNSSYKIEPEVFGVWMDILREVMEGVIWLRMTNDRATDNLQNEAEKAGIDSSRLIFAEKLPKDEYLARYRLADLFLYTFLYSAGSTAVWALYGGLPVLTYAGKTNASRMGASIVSAAGLPEMICHSHVEYLDRAVYYARHPDKLPEVKKDADLFNTRKVAGYLETAYLKMWEEIR